MLATIEKKILRIRNQEVLLGGDLAKLYKVPVKRLNEQVRRNLKRFPGDFMFQLTQNEVNSLRTQNATINAPLKRGQHSKYLPYAFTEQGVAMLSSVLNSDEAIRVNILIMRVFVKLRNQLSPQHRREISKLEGINSTIINSLLYFLN